MSDDFTFLIASLPDKEKVVCEIYFKGECLAELNQEEPSVALELYPHPSGKPWALDFGDLVQALEHAKKHLLGE